MPTWVCGNHVSIRGYSCQVLRKNVQLHVCIQHALGLKTIKVVILTQGLQLVCFVQTIQSLIMHKVLKSCCQDSSFVQAKTMTIEPAFHEMDDFGRNPIFQDPGW